MSEPMIFENALSSRGRHYHGFVVVRVGLIAEMGEGARRNVALISPAIIWFRVWSRSIPTIWKRTISHAQGRVACRARRVQSYVCTDRHIRHHHRIRFTARRRRRVRTARRHGREIADAGRGALADASERDLLRADHRMHLRCEVPSPDVVPALEAFLAQHRVDLISLMDHTPVSGSSAISTSISSTTAARPANRRASSRRLSRDAGPSVICAPRPNRPLVVAKAQAHRVPLASHDDTTLDEVARSAAEGVTIAEFPTTIEAAEASRDLGMATVMGAPNERGARRLAFRQCRGPNAGRGRRARCAVVRLRAGEPARCRLCVARCARSRRPSRCDPAGLEKSGRGDRSA